MQKIYDLIKLFFDKFEHTKSEERFNRLEWGVKHQSLKIPLLKALERNLKSFPQKDQVDILIQTDNRQKVFLAWNTKSQTPVRKKINDFINGIMALVNSAKHDQEETTFTINITIHKKVDAHNRIVIYSFENLVKYLSDRTLLGLYYIFNNVLKDREYIIFVFQDNIQRSPFYTSTFYFLPEGSNEKRKDIDKDQRNTLNNNRNEVTNFEHARQYRFIPEDFLLIKRSNNGEFNRIMDKLAILCSLTYLCNVSSLEKDWHLKCKLKGYKKVEQEIDFTELELEKKTDQKEEPKHKSSLKYIEIYKWTYAGGELGDKIELARNIISLHITEKDNLLHLEEGALESMRSSYEIYLKKNVQQYIDIRNKISEFIFDISEKVCETIDHFIGTFKKNLTAFISYSISLIISNSISGGKLKDIFTVEITVISAVILLVSFGFLIVSILEVNVRKKRLDQNYKKLKERYVDILDGEDLDKMFNKGFNIKEESKFIKKRIRKYILLWVTSILAFFLILLKFGNWPDSLGG